MALASEAGTFSNKDSVLPQELLKWDGKCDLVMGNSTDPSNVYLEIKCNNSVVWRGSIIEREYLNGLTDGDEPIVVQLFSIFVPLSQRRKGVANALVTWIHNILMQRAKNDHSFVFAIGPLIGDNDALLRIAKRLEGFQPCMPFSLLKRF